MKDRKNNPIVSSVTSRTKAISALGVVSAGILALLVNLTASRHYKRYDATYAKLYTLSEPSTYTLEEIERTGQDVEIYVFIGGGDPLLSSVRAMLTTYQSKAPTRLVVRYLDPDRDRAEFARLKSELDIHADKGEGGRILSDAQIVVRHAKRIWYVHTEDLTVVEEGEDAKARPRIEQALTGAIRAVLSTDRPRLCFTQGHAEASIADPEKQGLATLKNILAKDNFDPVTIEVGKPGASYEGCRLIAIVGPLLPFKAEDSKPIVEAVKNGASLLLVAQPDFDIENAQLRPTPHGLDELAALGGVALDDAVAVEEEPALREPTNAGFVFFAKTHPHVTTDLLRKAPEARATNGEPLIPIAFGRTMHKLEHPDVEPTELLVSSPHSFAMFDVHAFLASKGELHRSSTDRQGPLDLAIAAERPGKAGVPTRVVIVGTSYPFLNASFFEPSPPSILARKFALASMAWLTARPPILDLPPKPSVQVALHMTEEDISAIGRYVLLYMPFAVMLVGAAVWFRRRTTEAKRYRGAPGA